MTFTTWHLQLQQLRNLRQSFWYVVFFFSIATECKRSRLCALSHEYTDYENQQVKKQNGENQYPDTVHLVRLFLVNFVFRRQRKLGSSNKQGRWQSEGEVVQVMRPARTCWTFLLFVCCRKKSRDSHVTPEQSHVWTIKRNFSFCCMSSVFFSFFTQVSTTSIFIIWY